MAISEWGVQGDGGETFLHAMMAWIAAHDVVYATYWNAERDESGYHGKLSDWSVPAASAVLRDYFAG